MIRQQKAFLIKKAGPLAMDVFGLPVLEVGRGASSNLVLSLKGESPFGADLPEPPPDSQFSLMPPGFQHPARVADRPAGRAGDRDWKRQASRPYGQGHRSPAHEGVPAFETERRGAASNARWRLLGDRHRRRGLSDRALA